MKARGGERYRNPCLTMHQPWASLLVHGIKRIEGRSWPAPLSGRLWIHAAAKVPEPETINAMENFYREIYAVDGITDIDFPKHYPVSRLLGCVEIVGCLKGEELVCWEKVPQSVRLEGLTDFCWLCENPQKLVIPFEMRGYQGVYNLENRIYEAAVKGLTPLEGPLPVKFSLLDSTSFPKPRSPLSNCAKESEPKKSKSVIAAIAGARGAASQFSRINESSNRGGEHSDVISKHESVKMEVNAVADQPTVKAYNLRKGSIQAGENQVLSSGENLIGGGSLPRGSPEIRILTQNGSAKLFSEALMSSRNQNKGLFPKEIPTKLKTHSSNLRLYDQEERPIRGSNTLKF